jgi:hypothetical protein
MNVTRHKRSARRVLPGFSLTLGWTLLYLGLIVLVPLSALIFKTATLTWPQFCDAVTSPRVLASFRLTFGASLIAACVSAVFGLLIAWVLVRYRFAGRTFVDALVDLPFALPTAVAGISLTALLSANGWIGRFLEPHGIQIAFQPAGVVVALIFQHLRDPRPGRSAGGRGSCRAHAPGPGRAGGHAHAGRLTLGGISLPVPEYAHAEHAPAVAFVRPHELSVHRPDSGVEGMAVRLERVLIVGPIARLELIPTHVPAADAAVTVLAPHVAPIEAHLPADAFHAQAFTPGELLIVAPKKARVFLAQD